MALADDALTRITDRLLDISNRGNLVEQMSIGSLEAVELHRACVLDNKVQACGEIIDRSTEYGFASARTVALAHLTRGQYRESTGDLQNALKDFENAKKVYEKTPNIDAHIKRVSNALANIELGETRSQAAIKAIGDIGSFDQIARRALHCEENQNERTARNVAAQAADDCTRLQEPRKDFGVSGEFPRLPQAKNTGPPNALIHTNPDTGKPPSGQVITGALPTREITTPTQQEAAVSEKSNSDVSSRVFGSTMPHKTLPTKKKREAQSSRTTAPILTQQNIENDADDISGLTTVFFLMNALCFAVIYFVLRGSAMKHRFFDTIGR